MYPEVKMSNKTKYERADLRTWVIALSADLVYLPLFIHRFLEADTSWNEFLLSPVFRCHIIIARTFETHRERGSSWNPGVGSAEGCTRTFFSLGWAAVSLAPGLMSRIIAAFQKLVFITGWMRWMADVDAEIKDGDSSPIHKCPMSGLQTQRVTFSHCDVHPQQRGSYTRVCHTLRPRLMKLSLDTGRRPTMEERLGIESVNCMWRLLSDTHRKSRRIYGPLLCVCVISCWARTDSSHVRRSPRISIIRKTSKEGPTFSLNASLSNNNNWLLFDSPWCQAGIREWIALR